jgi:hypothetical protein
MSGCHWTSLCRLGSLSGFFRGFRRRTGIGRPGGVALGARRFCRSRRSGRTSSSRAAGVPGVARAAPRQAGSGGGRILGKTSGVGSRLRSSSVWSAEKVSRVGVIGLSARGVAKTGGMPGCIPTRCGRSKRGSTSGAKQPDLPREGVERPEEQRSDPASL